MKARVVLCCAVLFGCKFYDPELTRPIAPQPSNDAGTKAASLAEAPDAAQVVSCAGSACDAGRTAPVCASAKAPERAKSATAPSLRDIGPIYLGWSQLTLDSTRVGGGDMQRASFGLDLDGVCTNAADCPQIQDAVSCHARSAQLPYDGDKCIDNAFADLVSLTTLIPQLGQRYGWSEAAFNCGLRRGSYNMIMRITGFNGTADDPKVRVDWYTSNGLQSPPSWDCANDRAADHAQAWDASAPWRLSAAELVGEIGMPGQLPDSHVSDPDAFISGGVLVSQMPDGAALRLAGDGQPFRGFYLPLHEGRWIGRLVRGADDQHWSLRDGLVVGRARSGEVMAGLRDQGFCMGVGLDSFYEYVSMVVDEYADVLADGSDHPEALCDALSVGIGFNAAPVTPGSAGTLPSLLECCMPGATTEDCLAQCGDGMVSGSELCDIAIMSGAGACPTSCAAPDACTRSTLVGKACDAHCENTAAPAVSGDGCCAPDGTETNDADCAVSHCGNGVLERGETCDPSGSCPACKSNSACFRADASGQSTACTATCKLTAITDCKTGDGCCPDGCTRQRDGDCSASCGNSKLETGEACENGTDKPCPSDCDDHDPCTRDLLSGDAQHCNVQCAHELIAAPNDGDGCCRPGANPGTDTDCKMLCGNGAIDPGEGCDDGNTKSGDGCSAQCQKEKTVDPMCVSKLGRSDACGMCTCQQCPQEASDCYAHSSADDNRACVQLIGCVVKNGCQGLDCYCGSSTFLNGCLVPSGPCINETVAAAGGANTVPTLVDRSAGTDYAIGRARVLGECGWKNCSKECGF